MAYQLHLQLDDGLEDTLRAFAASNRLSLAAAVRFLLIRALKEEGEDITH